MFGVFVIRPLVDTFYYSFTDWNEFSRDYRFVWLGNFAGVVTDRLFTNATVNTLIWTYQPDWGLLNAGIKAVTGAPPTFAWLAEPETALYSEIVAWSWQQMGLAMVIFLPAGSRGDRGRLPPAAHPPRGAGAAAPGRLRLYRQLLQAGWKVSPISTGARGSLPLARRHADQESR